MHFDFLLFLACIAVCEAAGLTGIFTQFSHNTWFMGLRKPHLQPPGWVIEWVWAGVFILMGTALYLILRMPGDVYGRTACLILFCFQLVLTALWPLFFFRMKHPLLAFVELLILWMFVLGTVIWFSYVTITALFLLAPVMAWILFEAYWNFILVSLNEGPAAPSHM